jgi:small redox-active disulfide protein 2
MNIKIFGLGCKKCEAMEREVKKVIEELGIEAEVEKITDMAKIAESPVLVTPGLLINGKVKTYGRVPRREEIIKWIQEER